MNFQEYSESVESMMLYPRDQWPTYLGLALIGELGEYINEEKKSIRNQEVRIEKKLDELGDVLWYMTALGIESGFTLGDLFNKYMGYEEQPMKELQYQINKCVSGAADLHWQLTNHPQTHYVVYFIYPIFSAYMEILRFYQFDLEDVMIANISKLEGRRETNTIKEHS